MILNMLFDLPPSVHKFLSNLYNNYSKKYNQPADTPQRVLPVFPELPVTMPQSKNYVRPQYQSKKEVTMS